MEKIVDVFVCTKCGHEDSAFIPSGATFIDSKPCEEGYVRCPKCKTIVEKNIIQMPYEDYMTFEEYVELVKYINENHSFMNLKGKHIKYISHTLDLRSLTIYRIVLNDKEFVKINENRHRNLKKWIMDYLNS